MKNKKRTLMNLKLILQNQKIKSIWQRMRMEEEERVFCF